MSWDNTFLSWFADQGIPMTETLMSFGGLRYFQFSSAFDGSTGKRMDSFGCALDRKTAAIKCAAETVERRFLDQFYHLSDAAVPASLVQLDFSVQQTRESKLVLLPPKGMRTSNGWAVHVNVDQARTSACLEALERHLLLKSFYRWGWQGFRLVQEVQGEDMHLFS